MFLKILSMHWYHWLRSASFVLIVLCASLSATDDLYHRAYLLKESGRMHEALPLYKEFLREHPDHAHAHIGIAQAYLAAGNFTEGWRELIWRFGFFDKELERYAHYIQTHKRLDGKIVLLQSEWGIGDTVMMLRYAKLLKERDAVVKLALIHPQLLPHLKDYHYIDEIIPPGQPLPPYHLRIPMMSLPYAFGTTLEATPTPIPYLQADKQHVQQWRNCFDKKIFNIGICWHGNTIHDEKKFMPLRYFAQLATLPNVRLYSLQHVHGLDQLEELDNPACVTTFDDSFDTVPFADTLAVMQHLDLVITVDTSLAHFAGALGVPVWVVLPAHSDWRWLKNRTDSPWYPTMRLFRQEKGDWQKVHEKLITALDARLCKEQR